MLSKCHSSETFPFLPPHLSLKAGFMEVLCLLPAFQQRIGTDHDLLAHLTGAKILAGTVSVTCPEKTCRRAECWMQGKEWSVGTQTRPVIRFCHLHYLIRFSSFYNLPANSHNRWTPVERKPGPGKVTGKNSPRFQRAQGFILSSRWAQKRMTFLHGHIHIPRKLFGEGVRVSGRKSPVISRQHAVHLCLSSTYI